jgi:hypothetical protein
MTMVERRKYSRSVGSDVKSEMHRYKRGTGKGGPASKQWRQQRLPETKKSRRVYKSALCPLLGNPN